MMGPRVGQQLRDDPLLSPCFFVASCATHAVYLARRREDTKKQKIAFKFLGRRVEEVRKQRWLKSIKGLVPRRRDTPPDASPSEGGISNGGTRSRKSQIIAGIITFPVLKAPR